MEDIDKTYESCKELVLEIINNKITRLKDRREFISMNETRKTEYRESTVKIDILYEIREEVSNLE